MAIRQELELDTSSATAAIEALGQLLEATAAAFQQQLTSAIEAVAAAIPVIQVPVSILGESDLGQVVTSDIEGADVPDVEIPTEMSDVDGSPFAEGIEEGAAAANPQIEAEVDAELDPSGITDGVVEGIENAEGAEVDADVNLDGDNSALVDAVDEATGEATVDVDGDTTALEDAIDEIDGKSVDVDVDTGDSAEGLDKVKTSAAEATEEIDGMDIAVGALAASGKILAAGLAAVGAAAAGLFSTAIEAQGAIDSFYLSTGFLAEGLLEVDVNGFSANLRQLAQDVGSSDEAVLQASQTLALLGQNAGASNEEIIKTNSNLFGVAATLRVTNPQFGELDQIAARLPAAFAQGGRQARRFGLDLSAEQIRNRAYKDTLKDANQELTQFELVAAGAALAAEQFGDTMVDQIQNGLRNPIIQLESLKEVFGDALEEIGKPLISPVLNLIADSIPLALAFSEIMGQLAESLLPVAQRALKELAPPILAFTESVGEMLERLEPSFDTIGEAAVVLAEAFANVATVGLNVFLLSSEALIVLLEGLSALIVGAGEGVVTFGLVLYGLVKALKAVQVAMALGTLTFQPYLAAFALVGVAVGALISRNRESLPVWDELGNKVIESTSSIEGLAKAIGEYLSSLDEFIVSEKILSDPSLVENLNRAGISVQQFAGFVRDGEDGLSGLVQALKAGAPEDSVIAQVTEQYNRSAEAGVRQRRSLDETLLSAAKQTPVYRDLVRAQENFNSELENTSRAAFQAALATDGLNGTTARAIQEQFTARGEGENYTAMLTELEAQLDEATAAEERRKEASGESAEEARRLAAAYDTLVGEIALGITSSDNFSQSLERLGIDSEDAKANFDELSKGVADFSSTVQSNVPSVLDAFARLGEDDVTTNLLLDEFENSIAATVEWSDNLIRYASENKTALLQVAAELGPERTRLLVDGYKGNEEELNNHLFRMQLLETNARVEAEIAAKIGFLQQRGLFEGQYEELASVLRDKAFFGPLTREDLDSALLELQTFGPRLAEETGAAATGAADAYNENFVQGIETGQQPGQVALRNAIAAARSGGTDAATEAGRETGTAIGASLEAGLREALGPIEGLLVSKLLEAGFVAVANATPVGTQIADTLMGAWEAAILGKSNAVVRSVVAAVEETGIQGRPLASSTGNDLGVDVTDGIIVGVGSRRLDLLIAVGELLNGVAVANELAAYSAGVGLGESLMDGLAAGIARNVGRATEAAARAVREAEDAARLEAESESPSKAWERLGRDLVAGLSNGLNAASGIAARAASGVVSSASGAAGSVTNSNISVTVPVTISGDADPSVGRQIGQIAAAELRSVLRLEARVS